VRWRQRLLPPFQCDYQRACTVIRALLLRRNSIVSDLVDLVATSGSGTIRNFWPRITRGFPGYSAGGISACSLCGRILSIFFGHAAVIFGSCVGCAT